MTQRDGNPRYDDRALLARACTGDEHAFGRLFEHHRPGLEVLCELMLGDLKTANRVLTETVLTAWSERDVVEPSTTPRAWLYRIALRMCSASDSSATCLGDEIGTSRWEQR